MVLTAVDAPSQAYHTYRRFSMPTTGGSRDAIAVSANAADNLNSAYTFLLQMIVLSLWALIILFGLVFYLGRREHSHNSGVISTGIWNAKGSPFDVFRLTTSYFFKVKDRRRWLLLLWMILAVGILVANYAIPIKVAPYIILGNAAPVDPNAMYVPALDINSDASLAKAYALEVPSALRAAGSVQVANASTRARISVDQPEILQDLGDGEAILRIGYRYNITGEDFGLQHYPDLVLYVEGACKTEYDWLVTEDSTSGNLVDVYWPFQNPDLQQNASIYDSARPIAYFVPGSPTDPPGNWTWGAIVSSVDRQSYSVGTDPWYLTDTITGIGNLVRGQRPALSCWQNDVWSYHGHNSTIVGLNSTELPGLNMPENLQTIFSRFLGEPKIVILAQRLGPSVLLSTDTALGELFDAGSSNIHADLERLVFASYIATANTLTDTVLFPSQHHDIPNSLLGSDGQVLSGVDGFIVWSSEVRALSVRNLIIIPVIALAMFLLVYGLTTLPSPWYRIQALQATVLYSWAHEKAVGQKDSDLRRKSDVQYVKKGDVEQGVFRPHFDKHSRTLSWRSDELEAAARSIPPITLATTGQFPIANGNTTLSSPTSPTSPKGDEKLGTTAHSAGAVTTPPASELTDPILSSIAMKEVR